MRREQGKRHRSFWARLLPCVGADVHSAPGKHIVITCAQQQHRPCVSVVHQRRSVPHQPTNATPQQPQQQHIPRGRVPTGVPTSQPSVPHQPTNATPQQPQQEHIPRVRVPTAPIQAPPSGQFTPPEKRSTPFTSARPQRQVPPREVPPWAPTVRQRAALYEQQRSTSSVLLRSASSAQEMLWHSVAQPGQQRDLSSTPSTSSSHHSQDTYSMGNPTPPNHLDWLLQDMQGAAAHLDRRNTTPKLQRRASDPMHRQDREAIMWSCDSGMIYRAAHGVCAVLGHYWAVNKVHNPLAFTQVPNMHPKNACRVEAVLAPGGGYRVVRYNASAPASRKAMVPEEALFEVHMHDSPQ